MSYLKENGNIDIDYIYNLSNDEQMKVLECMTYEQLTYYVDNAPQDGVKVMVISESLQDKLNRGCVIAKDFIANLRKRVNQK